MHYVNKICMDWCTKYFFDVIVDQSLQRISGRWRRPLSPVELESHRYLHGHVQNIKWIMDWMRFGKILLRLFTKQHRIYKSQNFAYLEKDFSAQTKFFGFDSWITTPFCSLQFLLILLARSMSKSLFWSFCYFSYLRFVFGCSFFPLPPVKAGVSGLIRRSICSQ